MSGLAISIHHAAFDPGSRDLDQASISRIKITSFFFPPTPDSSLGTNEISVIEDESLPVALPNPWKSDYIQTVTVILRLRIIYPHQKQYVTNTL